MFSATRTAENEIQLSGRFDASQVETARETFNLIKTTSIVDFRELEYISSAGMGILLMTQKRLSGTGDKLRLKNVNKHIQDVFRYAGFDKIFEME